MFKITKLQASWVLDSRGLPTVCCILGLQDGEKEIIAKSSVPSGASTGSYEALELRDGGEEFHGKGVQKAIDNINNTISKRILNREFDTAASIDKAILELDTSDNKSMLGANAVLAVSMSAHRVFAKVLNLELWQYLRQLYFENLSGQAAFPRLMCNIINGGDHADNSLDIQEFMVVPRTGSISTDVRAASEIYHTLKNKLKTDGKSTSLGDEGGFAPDFDGGTFTAMDYITEAVKGSNYSQNCDLALDCAANEFYDKKKKVYNLDGVEYSASGLTKFYQELVEKYNLTIIEDGFNEDDIVGWQVQTEIMGDKTTLIGDDLFVTNPKRFQKIGLGNNIANAVLIKLNQIGSVTETCKMINMAKENNYMTAVSHRSGETADDFMSDLAFASQSEFIKLGAPARGERVVKYNRLLEISRSLKNEDSE